MMIKTNSWTARLLIAAVALVWSGAPQMAVAQSAQADTSAQTNQKSSQPNQGIVNPSQAPLQPVPPAETLPEAPRTQAQPQNTTGAQAQASQPQQPEGAAVGQLGVTTGGPASKPAGAAIAPAKQHQYRSLFLKIGALAAAGVAIGTVVALSKGSPSNPPGAH